MFTLEYFAKDGKLRKVEMNNRVSQERLGDTVERMVELIFPAPGKYYPYWEEMVEFYILATMYSLDGKLEDDMITLDELALDQPEMKERFYKGIDENQLKTIRTSYKRILEYRLGRREEDPLRKVLCRVIDEVEKTMRSPKFAKKVGKFMEEFNDKFEKIVRFNGREE